MLRKQYYPYLVLVGHYTDLKTQHWYDELYQQSERDIEAEFKQNIDRMRVEIKI